MSTILYIGVNVAFYLKIQLKMRNLLLFVMYVVSVECSESNSLDLQDLYNQLRKDYGKSL
jgi:hypothetical protein